MLAAAGATVEVAAPAETLQRFADGWSGTAAGAGSISAHPLEVGASLDPPRDLRAALVLRRLLRAGGPPLVHAHGVRAGLVALLAVRTLRPRPPLVVTLHNAVLGAGRRAALGRRVQSAVCRGADVVLGVSGDLVAAARAAGARTAERALVPAPAGVPARDREVVRAQEDLGDALVVLTVARLAPQKGLDDLLDVLATTPRTLTGAGGSQDVVWLLAGDGPLRGELADRIAARRLPVRLLGARRDVPDLLAACDVVVVTSVWEGQPVFVQEALRAGRPLVATDAGGTREVTGDAADLAPVHDVGALAAAVRALLDDPAMRARRGADARRRAAQLPTDADVLAQVRRVFALGRTAARPKSPGVG
ncbi:glycosyltransferase family 4 protein [Kineosporiaceae bacterium B12]|nr:glycosyltransferase family 4 protein [Kineococcus rubinsiae]